MNNLQNNASNIYMLNNLNKLPIITRAIHKVITNMNLEANQVMTVEFDKCVAVEGYEPIVIFYSQNNRTSNIIPNVLCNQINYNIAPQIQIKNISTTTITGEIVVYGIVLYVKSGE